MRKTKNIIKKTAILGITAITLMVATLTTGVSSASAAKVKKAGDYVVTKLNIPYYNDLNVDIFKESDEGIAVTIKYEKKNSKGHYIFDSKCDYVMESKKITWSESGEIKTNKIADIKRYRYRTKSYDKGRLFYFSEKKEKKITVDHLYVCNSTGKRIKDIEVSKLRKFFIPDEERNIIDSTGIVDYEVKGKYVDILMTEFGKKSYHEKVYSLQRFNWKTGKLVKAYRLDYAFDRIIDGKLYGETSDYYEDEAKPIESGFYVYNKSGKKCLYQKEGEYSHKFDVVDDKIIYQVKEGVYALDMSEEAEPELLITAKDFPLLKKYNNWIEIYAMSEDDFYITYMPGEYYHGWDSSQMIYRFKKK